MSYPTTEAGREIARAKARERYNRNRDARIAQVKAWREANRDRVRETDGIRRNRDIEAYNLRQREWRARNPEKAAESFKAWKQRNPEAVAAMARCRRARVRGAQGSVTPEQWRERLELFDNRCAYCGSKDQIEMDHMIPISRGGPHSAGNVVPACLPCNRSKGALTVPEFFARRSYSKGKS